MKCINNFQKIFCLFLVSVFLLTGCGSQKNFLIPYDADNYLCGVGGEETVEEVALPPVEIILKTKTNVAAILALVASILSCIPIFPPLWWITEPICWIVGLVLALIGLSAAKTCRKGKGYAIAALCVCAAAVLFAVVWVIAIFVLSGATVLLEMLASGMYEF